ncbi:MAG: leucine-rich repeat domain-containing protein [Candidatus Methanomethylophilaceae archaeon]|nr:leucine-rich repeat domain-containing protein [Candidatus Methanomethylophilaceae archaeon]
MRIILRGGDPVRVEGAVSCGGSDWTVVSVENEALQGCDSLVSVSLPSATYVGECAFSGCDSLVSASLPSAESVEDCTFEICSSLVSASLPSATEVKPYAFAGCGSLRYVGFSGSLSKVWESAFEVSFFSGGDPLGINAESLRGREFAGDGEGILYEGFSEGPVCYAIVSEGQVSAVCSLGSPASLSVPTTVEHGGVEYVPVSIAAWAFAVCPSVTSVSIGDSVVSIGEGALDAPMLRSIEVSAGNLEYSSIDGVLYDKGATTLLKFPASKQRLAIPGGVTAIGAYAFRDAGKALKDAYSGGDIEYFRYVKIPAAVTSIGEGAFAGSALECLKFSGGSVSIGLCAFSGCSSLSYVVFGAEFTEVGDFAFSDCIFYDGEKVMDLAEAMAGHKFTGADSSRLELYVPPLRGTIADGGVKYRITDNGADSKKVTAVRLAGDDVAEISIHASISYLGFDWEVTSIAPKAFLRSGSIVSVTSEVDVGRSAFHGCRNLTSVTLDGAASVGAYAFFGCSSLSTVDLGCVTSLGTSAFSGCESLSAVDLSGVASVGKHAFYRCALTEADLTSAMSIGYGAFTGNDLRRACFGGALEKVDPKAFFGYSFWDGDGGKVKIAAKDLAGRSFEGSGKSLEEAAP